MMMQTGKYWVSDYLSLFLQGISFWKFLSNEKQSISLAIFFKMAGELAEHITLFAS